MRSHVGVYRGARQVRRIEIMAGRQRLRADERLVVVDQIPPAAVDPQVMPQVARERRVDASSAL